MVTTMMSARATSHRASYVSPLPVSERAAVNPHHHRPRRPRRRRRPHVEAQAVLVALLAELRVSRRGPGCSAVPGSVASRMPVQAGAGAGGRKRSGPDRRCRVRDAGEQPVIGLDDAAHHACGRLRQRGIRLWPAASGSPVTAAARISPGWPPSAMPRRAVRARPPAPSPARRAGPPAGFEPSLAARSPSLRSLSAKTLDHGLRRSPRLRT